MREAASENCRLGGFWLPYTETNKAEAAQAELRFPTPQRADPGHPALFFSAGCILGSRWEG